MNFFDYKPYKNGKFMRFERYFDYDKKYCIISLLEVNSGDGQRFSCYMKQGKDVVAFMSGYYCYTMKYFNERTKPSFRDMVKNYSHIRSLLDCFNIRIINRLKFDEMKFEEVSKENKNWNNSGIMAVETLFVHPRLRGRKISSLLYDTVTKRYGKNNIILISDKPLVVDNLKCLENLKNRLKQTRFSRMVSHGKNYTGTQIRNAQIIEKKFKNDIVERCNLPFLGAHYGYTGYIIIPKNLYKDIKKSEK